MKPTIKFEALADTVAPLSRQLVCTVWSVDKSSEPPTAVEPVVDKHPILIGSVDTDSVESEISLPAPGDYFVDLGFPNGRRTRRAVSVTTDKPYRFLIHESRYALNSISNVPSNPSFLKEFPRVVMSAARSFIAHSDLEVKLSVAQAAPGTASLRTLRDFLKNLESKSSDAVLVSRVNVAERVHTVLLASTPANADSKFQSATHRRAWLLISGQGKDTTVVPFPSGWTSGQVEDPFLLTVSRKTTAGDEATKWSVSLQLRDPSYGSLVGYLTRRDYQACAAVSHAISTRALAVPYKKQKNPYVAVAEAYRLAMEEKDANITADHWMAELTEQFPWLPDGPIAQGYQLLRWTEKGTEEFEHARSLLFKGSDRGLPYFTIGLTLLTEALNFLVLASPEDTEAKEHLAAAVSAQIACVSHEAFCTLQTSRFYRLPQGQSVRT